MQHLAQEIPKLLIVGNTEDIKRGGVWRGNHSECTLFLYSSPKHLPLSAV